jgi:RND family efflux transporter MFP subunit
MALFLFAGRGILPVLSASMLAAACSRGDALGAEKAATKIAVNVTTLHASPVRDTNDYLAQLVSRHHVSLFPQVAGIVGAIHAKPGDVVKAGAPLLQIDPRKEAANLQNQLATRAQKEANLTLARANEKRTAALFREGLASRQQYDQEMGLREVAEQDLKAQDATIHSEEAQLGFYRIVAPFEGTVGDIPVKLGDYVTPQTKLTSVAENGMLEAYVKIPADKLGRIGNASRVQVLGPSRVALCEAPIGFVAEEADPLSQTVLLKAPFANAKALRAGQVVPARVVWSTRTGIHVPTSVVTRQAGQYFVFVAEGADDGAIARQKAVELGDVDDNRFVVESGLKEGDRLITSQLQKLRDGAPVVAEERSETASNMP